MSKLERIIAALQQLATTLRGSAAYGTQAQEFANRQHARTQATFPGIAARIASIGARVEHVVVQLRALEDRVREAIPVAQGIGGAGAVSKILSALKYISDSVDDVRRSSATAVNDLDRLKGETAASLQGGQPGPLLGLLDQSQRVMRQTVAQCDTVGTLVNSGQHAAKVLGAASVQGVQGQSSDSEAPPTKVAEGRGAAEKTVEAVARKHGLHDPTDREALAKAYNAAHSYTAPFIVRVSAEILADLKQDVERDPDRRIVFVGRDGHSMAVAVRALDKEFFDKHCVEVVLSRALVETALQDREVNLDAEYPQLKGFRGAAKKVDQVDVPGASQRLTAYLKRQQIPVGRDGSKVTLVDTSYKGTVQELLAALYPKTDFQGRYVFFGASPDDPHPGSKKGYALNLPANEQWDGKPVDYMPRDPNLTFASQDAIGVIEETLHGPLSSPKRLAASGPEQKKQRFESDPLVGLNPTRVSGSFTRPEVREGAKAVAIDAVRDYATGIRAMRRGGDDWRAKLDSDSSRFRAEVRAWVERRPTDPIFGEVMDSLVRRSDKGIVKKLMQHLRQSNVSATEADRVWPSYDQLDSPAEREDFVRRLLDERP